MAKQAREAIGTKKLTVVADAGYFKSLEILACHQAGITALVPTIETSGKRVQDGFERKAFRYLLQKNEYRCLQPMND
jgi:hypothetical protein